MTEFVKICPGCGEPNAVVAFDCVACRFVLDNVDPVAKSAPAESPRSGEDSSESVHSDQVICPDPTCGQLSPANSDSCIYCNRPLKEGGALDADKELVVEWPWGVELFEEKLFVGRAPPTDPQLAARLENQYSNVSRQHGYVRRCDAGLVVCDLGSVNGTFVNDKRIEPQQEVALKAGDRIRFASRLLATIRKAST